MRLTFMNVCLCSSLPSLTQAVADFTITTALSEERRDVLSLEMRHGDLELSNLEMELQLRLLQVGCTG